MSQQSANQHQSGHKEQDRWAHPATIAVITGVLTLAGTLTAALIAARDGNLPGQQTSEATVTVTTTAQSTVTTTVLPGGPTADPTGAPATTRPPGQITWKKKMRLPGQASLDIDEVSPKVLLRDYASDGEFWMQEDDGFPWVNASGEVGIASVAAPSAQQCREAIATNARSSGFTLEVGKTMCLLSERKVNRHLASVRIVKFDKSDGSADLDVTVWQEDE